MRRIINVRLPDPSPKAKENDLWEIVLDHQDMVAEVNHMSTCSALNGDNWLGDFLSPMGIDLQMNGGLGLDFSDLNFDQLSKLDRLLDLLWLHGSWAGGWLAAWPRTGAGRREAGILDNLQLAARSRDFAQYFKLVLSRTAAAGPG